jgi:hypothetical protein
MLNAFNDTKEWAEDQLAAADFGNVVRARRCAAMLRRAAEHPCGRLTEVFDKGAELEGAYRFVEGRVAPGAMIDSFAKATLRSASGLPYIFAVLDGTSLSLTDRGGRKDFGSVGARQFPTRGLKVVDAIGIDPDGVPLGLLDLHFWARGAKAGAAKHVRRHHGETETQHWRETIERVAARAADAHVQPWFVIDREGDAAVILRAIERAGGIFTVRVSQRARRCVAGGKTGSLMQAMARRPVVGTHFVDVPKSAKRKARTAAMDVCWGRVELALHEDRARPSQLPTYVVWVRERRAPRGEERLDWMLYTNREIVTYADALAVVDSYCHRWRVEDFHRSWKRGHCRVEDSQLRQRDHVVRWAAMLATVALRVERLKHLARTKPDEPATIGLTEIEVEALRVAKRERFSKRTETITDAMPTISTAVLWIGQFGGFHGRGTAKPGSTTLGRGLERLLVFAAGFERGLKMARKRG